MTIPEEFKVVIRLVNIDAGKATLEIGSIVQSNFESGTETIDPLGVGDAVELTLKPCFVAMIDTQPIVIPGTS